MKKQKYLLNLLQISLFLILFAATPTLALKHDSNFYTVSGYVKSSDNGDLVPAYVEFIPESMINGTKLIENTSLRFTTEVNSDGRYSIDLPNYYIYSAHAIPKSRNYAEQYYNSSSNPLAVNRLRLTGSRDDIDFNIDMAPGFNNGFSGSVTDNNGSPVTSMLVAIMLDENGILDLHPRYFRKAETDNNGNFTFNDLEPGRYILFSIPVRSTLLPGYYTANNTTTTGWRHADFITIGNEMLPEKIVIKHNEYNPVNGFGRFGGDILEQRDNVRFSNRPDLQSIPINGAYVYAVDDRNNIVSYTFSDENGNFRFNNLPEGRYTISVDKPGYTTKDNIIDIKYPLNSDVVTNIMLTPEGTSETEVAEAATEDVIQSFPEPIRSDVNIQFTAASGLANITIYNSLGNLVYETDIETYDGINTYNIDMSSLPNGFYFLRIKMGNRVNFLSLNVLK